ncbi:MAG: [acyl-carrier-protein] S-malonyltransferase [Vampirovibrio sp.]|jgi:[acyl-carrier-protein] S-malonyltransferase|nr:[acyl-carrier-protein] S-malonyltransferase [Vampirovibrio sp.]
MSKIAFVFPGQGSQSVGMGQDFFEQAAAKKVYETFDRLVAPNLSLVCFNGPEEELRRTLYTQPSILATSLAALELLREKTQVKPVIVAGHSLGEYGALYAAGVISLETAAQLVKERSKLMESAPKGAMSAVLGLEGRTVEDVVDAYRKEFHTVIAVANYNTDNQTVISGAPEAVEKVSALLKEAGAKRVMPLPVGGAFHSPLMNAAAESFTAYLSDFEFQTAQIPVITNVDAALTTDATDIRQKLGRQIDSSVRWTQTMNRMIAEQGIDTVVEIGPGKVLTGMFKKMFPDVRLLNVLDLASVEETAAQLNSNLASV